MKFGKKSRRAESIGASIWSAKPRFKPSIETLESRILLSTYITDPFSEHLAAHQSVGTPTIIDLGVVPQVSADSLSAPFNPSQIRQAYGVDQISFNGTAGTGAAQTIAIVDAYSDPDIISDANAFSSNFGLPQFNGSGEPTLTVLNQDGGTSLPGTPTPGTWDAEESLDVEWAHAMAPDANIILFEANTNSTTNLFKAVSEAADYAGVSVVSMSWENSEVSGETSLDSDLTTPKGHQGVTFVASTGDVGGQTDYPSTSPNVLAVGATSLTINSDGSYGSESAWADGGGGVSQYESQPSYQTGNVNGASTTNRTVPDVSIDGDPNTGVYLLDTFDNASYQEAGGTSLAAPMWAGLIADADQGLALKGDGTLNGATQTLPDLYNLPSSDFHDITTGSNGFPATTGYDLATGLGTPIANLLVPALAGYSTTSTASSLVFTQQPSNVTAGNSIGPSVVVKIEDQDGNVLSDDNSDVTFSVNSGPGSLVGTPVTVQAVDGVATFSNLVLDTAGNYTLKASDSTDSLSNFASSSFTVSPAVAEQLVYSRNPSSGTAGTALSSVALTIEDQFNNVETGDTSSVSISASGPGSLTGSSTTTVSAVKGVATFSNLVLDTSGSYTLSATDSSDSLSSGASNSFSVSPAAANKLVFTTEPSAGTAGVALSSVGVTIEDQFGNIETGDSSSVTIAASGPGPLTGSSTTSASASKGVANFSNLVLDTAGSYTLKASDSSDTLSNFASSSFSISPTTASKIVFTSQPTSGTAGTALASANLSIEDQFGNVETGDTTSVTIAATGPGPLTGSSTASVNAVDGVAKFTNLLLDTAGSYTLKATDATDSLTSAASTSFTVSPAAATQLLFTTNPISGTAGTALASVALTIEDQFGNVETGDNSTVTVTAAGPGSLVGSPVGVSASKGIATFSDLVLDTAGSYTLKATDSSDSLTSAASNSFSVSPASASRVIFSAQPVGTTAGDALASVSLTIEDQFGNTETGDTSSVSIAVTGPGPLASGSVSAVNAAAGVATFNNLTLDTAGSYTLKATDSSDSLTSPVSNSFTITPATASQLVFTIPPTSGTAGSPLSSVALSIEDRFGNVETGDTSSVSISPTGPGAFTGGSTTSVTASAGVANFSNLVLDTSGSYTLKATDTADSLTSAASNSFNVAAATSNKLVFTQESTAVTAGVAITPSVVVKIEDENGNVLTSDTSNVTLTVQSGPGSLVGGTVTAQASGGVATFSNLILDTAGAYMLSASDGTDGLSNFASTSFTVSPTTAGKLVITTQPTGGTAGKAIASVTFTIEDQFNNVETSDSSSVLVSAGGPGSLAGGSTASVAANKGVATFSNLILDTAGGYTLSASDSTDSVSSGASNSFTIAPATAMQLMFTTPPTSGTAGSTLSPVALSIEDAFGNVETGDTSTVSIAATGPGLLTGSSTASVSAIKGVATFSNLTLDTAGSYTLKGTDAADSLASAASGAFNVNPASSDKLVFTQEPTSVMAGNAISPTVTVKIEDQNGNVLTGDDSNVSLTVDTGPGALVGGTVTAQASGGIATFSNLVLDTAGAYTLSASDTTDGLSNFSSSSFTVSPAAASKLVFTTGPVNGTAGSAISQVALSIEDQFGNVEIGDTSNVVISAAGPGALSAGSTTTVAAVKGVATFSNLVLDTTGSYTLSAADSTDSLSSGPSTSFSISTGSGEKLVFTAGPASATAGNLLSSISVSIEDQFGNVESGDTSAVSITANGPGSFAAGSTTIANASAGVATFGNLTLDTAGSYTLTVTDSADGIHVTSASITISPTAASQLVFSAQPTDGTTTAPLAPISVTIEDQFGNPETSDTSAVSLTITSAPFGGAFTNTSTLSVNAVAGIATFSNLTLNTAGSYAFTASDTTDSITSPESNRFTVTTPTVTAPVASQLVFLQPPTDITAGGTITPAVTVQIEDSGGDVMTGDDSQVTIAIDTGPSGATLGGTLTVAAKNGVATFSDLSLATAGQYTLQVTDTADGLTSAASNAFTVNPVVSTGVATHLVFIQEPTSATAGSTLSSVIVAAEDQNGNIVTTDDATVTLAIDGPNRDFRSWHHRGSMTIQLVDGEATFSDLSLRRAGAYTLTAYSHGLTGAVSTSFTITPAAATHMIFQRVPCFTTDGKTFDVQIVLVDKYGNIATNDTSTITLSLGKSPSGAALGGTLTATVTNGVATFSGLSVNDPGTYTLVATDSNSIPVITSAPFCVPAARNPFFRCFGFFRRF